MRPCSKEGFLMARHSQQVVARDSPLLLQQNSCAQFAVLQNKKEVKQVQSVEWEATEMLEDMFCQETREKVSQGAGCRSSRGARARLSWEVHSNRAGDGGHKWQ